MDSRKGLGRKGINRVGPSKFPVLPQGPITALCKPKAQAGSGHRDHVVGLGSISNHCGEWPRQSQNGSHEVYQIAQAIPCCNDCAPRVVWMENTATSVYVGETERKHQ